MKEIVSPKNALLKELKKLEKKKYREAQGRYLVEGHHLVEEALKAGADVALILVNETGKQLLPQLSKLPETVALYSLSEAAFKSLSTVPAPQGIIAVLNFSTTALPVSGGPLLLLDRVQDPGNVGTMIRTADAANIKGVILGEGCADIYNDKVLRAMQGSHFHLEVVSADLEELIPTLKKQGRKVFGTALDSKAIDYRKARSPADFALIMGNEGQGVADTLLQLTDANLYIPITGQAESLNVAVAAGILMFTLKG